MRVFQYLTFRAMATLTSLLVVLFFCPAFIRWMQSIKIKQSIRTDGPQTHLKKGGTPTMGGVLILFSIVLATLLWGKLTNLYLILVLLTLVGYGLLGWYDDYLKVIKGNSDGVNAKAKLLCQATIALAVVCVIYFTNQHAGGLSLLVPFFKDTEIDFGVFFVFALFVVVGSSNAVNLTDGLDGLATMPVVLVVMTLAVFAYVSSNVVFAKHLNMIYLSELSELAVFCGRCAGLGFLVQRIPSTNFHG